jgi:hypothetical protein
MQTSGCLGIINVPIARKTSDIRHCRNYPTVTPSLKVGLVRSSACQLLKRNNVPLRHRSIDFVRIMLNIR